MKTIVLAVGLLLATPALAGLNSSHVCSLGSVKDGDTEEKLKKECPEANFQTGGAKTIGRQVLMFSVYEINEGKTKILILDGKISFILQ